MPYTDWNYTNPGWTNENPPAINESNLNDISDSLEKFFVHWWERGTMNHQDIDARVENIQVNSVAVTPPGGQSYWDVEIYETVSYDISTKKYTHTNPLKIQVQNGQSLSNYTGYYAIEVSNDGTYCNKITSATKVRVGGNTVIFDDTTQILPYDYFEKVDVVCSDTKDFPDYGQQGDYFYIYIGIPAENALDSPTIISYIGNGTNNIQMDVGKPFNVIIWANWINGSSAYSIGSFPMIIHQTNKLMSIGNYTIDGTVVNIELTTTSSYGYGTNIPGTSYYLLVL